MGNTLSDKAIVLASNGYGEGNAEAMVEFLRRNNAGEIWVLKHPLVESPTLAGLHTLTIYRGDEVTTHTAKAVHYAPYTYFYDAFLPSLPRKKIDLWLGFGPNNVMRGMLYKLRTPVGRIGYACVDYTPDRFGAGTPLTRLYGGIDRLACSRADFIWPISQASHDERMRVLKLTRPRRVRVVPMGAWLDRVPRVQRAQFKRSKIVFLGGLIEKQGVQVVLDALTHLPAYYTLSIIGKGPYEHVLKEKSRALGLGDRVEFHGFVADHRDVESLLAEGTVAVACYSPEMASFSRYADPGKIKAYLGAGLPVVLTDVSPNAREVAAQAGGALCDYDASSVAATILDVHADEQAWFQRVTDAQHYMEQFDWQPMLHAAFEEAFS